MAAVTADSGHDPGSRWNACLAASRSDLTSEPGRARAEQLIDDTLRTLKAEQLSASNNRLADQELEAAARELRDELVGLGAIAEQMLSGPRRAGVDDQSGPAGSSETQATRIRERVTSIQIQRQTASCAPAISASTGCSSTSKGNGSTGSPR